MRNFVPPILRTLTVLSLALLPVAGTFGQPAQNPKLDEIDRSFICPENQPSDQTRRDAVKQFLQQMTTLQPSPTLGQVMDFRASLLRKHNCTKTLENIESSKQSADDNSSIADRSSKDRWKQIAKTSGANPITVSIDTDRAAAGPEYVRIWIKYLSEQPDEKKVKEQLVHEKIDCEKKSHLAVSLYAYDSDGHILYGGSDESGKADPVTQGTLLDNVLSVVCPHR